MSRTSKFDRERMKKLFGKEKPIHKAEKGTMLMKAEPKMEETPAPYRPFKSSNYVTMEKAHYTKHAGLQIQKVNFRCFNDSEIFGEDMIKFLKKNHDQDHDTPPEQVRFDVSVGIKRFKESLDTYSGPDNDCASSVKSQGSKGMLRYESMSVKSHCHSHR